MSEVEQIIGIIQEQFDAILLNKVVVTSEQMFNASNRENDKLYVVVKFGSASTNFNQKIIPITMNIFGFPNESVQSYSLLISFVNANNLNQVSDGAEGLITQLYNTPSVTENFINIDNNFRQMWSIIGQIALTKNSSFIQNIKYTSAIDGAVDKKVEVLSTNFSFTTSPNTQVNYSSEVATTVNVLGTFTLALSCYFDTSYLIRDIMNIVRIVTIDNAEVISIDQVFRCDIKFLNDDTLFSVNLKLSSITVNQPIGGIPMANLTFVH